MSSSTPACNFISPPTGYGGRMLHYPIEKKEHETFSHIEYYSTKRARTGENFVHNQRMPAAMNKAMSGNFENRLSQNFKLGHHTYGNQGLFTHGARDNEKQFTRTWNAEDRLLDEQKLCQMFHFKKTCKYEDMCRYLHVNPERVEEVFGQFTDRSVISIMTGKSSGDKRSGSDRWEQKGFVRSRSFYDRVNQKPMWKTKLCRNWEMTRSCLYGQICYFAHCPAELRNLGSNNAWEYQIVPVNISNTVSTINDHSGTTSKQQVLGMKSIFKWKELEKISGIYADWIEDMPLLHTSPNKVKN